ncbi:MAG TPA: hypothetical protein DDY18_06210 [Flavobacterium sp.]|jgi:hypothetical protein|nr:hypothetical protein [Flavobacterium sp.]
MKDKKVLKKKIMEDPDFIYCPRLGNSLTKLVNKHPDGIDDERIEKVLLMTKSEIETVYQSALEKLRDFVK